EVTGPDAGRLLDLVYANAMSGLKVGRMRYGVMLREDGHVLDDGTVARFAANRFFLTTTTAHAEKVLRHMEFCHQVLAPSLDVSFVAVTDRWPQIARPAQQACGWQLRSDDRALSASFRRRCNRLRRRLCPAVPDFVLGRARLRDRRRSRLWRCFHAAPGGAGQNAWARALRYGSDDGAARRERLRSLGRAERPDHGARSRPRRSHV